MNGRKWGVGKFEDVCRELSEWTRLYGWEEMGCWKYVDVFLVIE